MTRPGPFEQRLEAWLDEGPATAPPDLLGDVLAAVPATTTRRRPSGAGRRFTVLAGVARLAASIAAILVVGVIGFTLINSKGAIGPGSGPSPTATAPDLAPTIAPTIGPASPGATPAGVADCAPDVLSATVVAWNGAAGSRIAEVRLTNTGSAPCLTATLDRVSLVSLPAFTLDSSTLIQGANPTNPQPLTLAAGETVTAGVAASNYCGEAPAAPVTVAFELSNGAGIVTAAPVNQTDVSGVPPCNGPGSPGSVQMQPWAP
ncbi:MAG: DUF4232 domain-containing protein [Chloroflexi bacterium]|nr:DUF4232 domain-containing protein [Chloroflexota bacterium]